jgi:hypothetical protein
MATVKFGVVKNKQQFTHDGQAWIKKIVKKGGSCCGKLISNAYLQSDPKTTKIFSSKLKVEV